jgi:hypothetical protein
MLLFVMFSYYIVWICFFVVIEQRDRVPPVWISLTNSTMAHLIILWRTNPIFHKIKFFRNESVIIKWNYKYERTGLYSNLPPPTTLTMTGGLSNGSASCWCLRELYFTCFRQYRGCKSHRHNVLVYFRQPRDIRFWIFTARRLMVLTYQITRCRITNATQSAATQ